MQDKRRCRMKYFLRLCLFSLTMIALIQLSACSKDSKKTYLPVQEVITTYMAENLISYTVAEDGVVYIADSGITSQYQEIHSFDTEGNKKDSFQVPIEYCFGDCLAVSVKRDSIYFTAQYNTNSYSIFSMNLSTKEITKVSDFTYFDGIQQMELIDDRLYLMGIRSQVNLVDDNQMIDSYQGQQLVFYDLESEEVYQIDIEKPISMSVSEDMTLVIQAYKDKKYCLIEYTPKDSSMEELYVLSNHKFDKFAICNKGKSLMYSYSNNSRGLVLSDCTNLDVETEL